MTPQRKRICVVCGESMTLLDEENDRWYCYRDDVVVVRGVEVDWRGNRIRPLVSRPGHIIQPDKTRIFDLPDSPVTYCFYCGRKMPNDACYCRYCGRQQIVPE